MAEERGSHVVGRDHLQTLGAVGEVCLKPARDVYLNAGHLQHDRAVCVGWRKRELPQRLSHLDDVRDGDHSREQLVVDGQRDPVMNRLRGSDERSYNWAVGKDKPRCRAFFHFFGGPPPILRGDAREGFGGRARQPPCDFPAAVLDGLLSKNEGTYAEQGGLALHETRVALQHAKLTPIFDVHPPLSVVHVATPGVREEVGVSSSEKSITAITVNV